MAAEMSSSQSNTAPVPPIPAAVSPTTSTASPTNQQTTSDNQQRQPPQQQGQFQPAYFQQDPRAYGQPFQPYGAPQPGYTQQLNQYQQQQQYQYQFQQQQQLQQQQAQPYTNNVRKGWVFMKASLHVADIIFCIIAIALSFSLNNVSYSGYAFMLCTPVFFVAMVWDAAELITWFVRKRQAGIHPGAHVGMSLLIWMAAAVVGGIESTFVAYSVYDYDYGSCWDSENQEYVECTDDRYAGIRGRFLGAAVFACLVWSIHFALFIGACIDTAKRNAMRRVMVVAPPYWGHAVQGWQPMPQNYPVPQGQGQVQQNAMMTPPQSIPLQTRSPAPTEQSGKGKEVDRGESSTQPVTEGGIKEYYTPSAN